MIYLQTKLGPRFFVPSYFLPAKYNYYLKMNDELLGKEVTHYFGMESLFFLGTMFNLHGQFKSITFGNSYTNVKNRCWISNSGHENAL